MAGDWIKMRGNLWDDPRVAALVDATDSSEAAVIGALYWLWSTADQHTETGVLPGLSLRQIDRKTGVVGLGKALCAIGWLVDGSEGVRITHFEEHNGSSAKKRLQTAKRVAEHAANAKAQTGDDQTNDALTPIAEKTNAASVSEALPREREEKSNLEPTVLVDGKPPTIAEPHRIDCPYQKLLEAWGEEATSLAMPKPVAEWSTGRKTAVRLRWQEKMKLGKYRDEDSGVAYWRRLFAFVQESDFLAGRVPPRAGHKPFTADIDWVFNPTNLQKIIEGKYANAPAVVAA